MFHIDADWYVNDGSMHAAQERYSGPHALRRALKSRHDLLIRCGYQITSTSRDFASLCIIYQRPDRKRDNHAVWVWMYGNV